MKKFQVFETVHSPSATGRLCTAVDLSDFYLHMRKIVHKPQSLCEARSKSNPNVIFRQKVSRAYSLYVSQFIDAPIAFNFAKPLKAQSSQLVLIFIFGFDLCGYVCSAHQDLQYTFLNWHRHVLNVYDSRMSNGSLTSMQLFRFERRKKNHKYSLIRPRSVHVSHCRAYLTTE